MSSVPASMSTVVDVTLVKVPAFAPPIPLPITTPSIVPPSISTVFAFNVSVSIVSNVDGTLVLVASIDVKVAVVGVS